MQVSYFQGDQHALNTAALTGTGASEGDAAYVLGFPMGLVGEQRNAVIVRSGAIARIRDVLAGKGNQFLVDASIFPGNSGGPVVTPPEIVAIQGTKAHGNAGLIGIVRAYVPYRDEAVSRQTGMTRVIFEENSGLAAVHPVDCIEQTIAAHRESLKPQPVQTTSAPEGDGG
jgi:S1-C subfamily serine protease